MNYEQVVSNLAFVLPNGNLNRARVDVSKHGIVFVELDLHGLTCQMAKRLVRNVININRGRLIISIIHGYNHGTVLKEMLMNTQFGARVKGKSSPPWNPGKTYLTIAA